MPIAAEHAVVLPLLSESGGVQMRKPGADTVGRQNRCGDRRRQLGDPVLVDRGEVRLRPSASHLRRLAGSCGRRRIRKAPSIGCSDTRTVRSHRPVLAYRSTRFRGTSADATGPQGRIAVPPQAVGPFALLGRSRTHGVMSHRCSVLLNSDVGSRYTALRQ